MKDKVVIVTGGSSGIGKSLTVLFGKKGASVVFTGRDEARMKTVSRELEALGVRHLALTLDAASEKDNKQMVEMTLREFGRIDVLICNAGITMRALFEEVDLEVFKQLMDINFYGTLFATKYALPHLLTSRGSVIGISSINGYRGTPARTAYTASKFAMQGFFESLRTEVMYRGVHVLVVCPGFTGTNIRNNALTADGKMQGDSPRDESKMMTPDEVAEKTFAAYQSKKRDLILTTQGKLAVWLNKWMPGKMDKIVYQVMAKEPDSPFK